MPQEPGLGVELDREALTRLHQNYLDCGLTKRDGPCLMRFVPTEFGKGHIGSTGKAVFQIPLRLSMPDDDGKGHSVLRGFDLL